jgi:hypothetical protein
MMKTKPNPLANLKRHLTMLIVVIELVALLCLEKTIMDILEEGITVRAQMLYGWNPGITSLIATQGRRVSPVDNAERSIAQRRVE